MIVITNPESLVNEAYIINRLFEEGLQLLHIRKPEIDRDDLERFIDAISKENHHKLVLHQHYDLTRQFNINRLHFTEKTRPDFDKILNRLDSKKKWIFSTSTHSIEDFNNLPHRYEYAFLSPVYDSISKLGYTADFDLCESVKKRTNFKTRLIALGGITSGNSIQVLQSGFDDVAVLGAIWNAEDPVKEFKKNAIMKSKIQYISQGNTVAIQIENIKSVLDAGCNWVQLRYKNVPEAEVLYLAEQVKKMIEWYDCTFIINDYPKVAKTVDADGIHLGLDDMDISEARTIIGIDKIIGGTANTLSDVIQRHKEQCDYIGLGPFRFTSTKEKLSPIVGLEGFNSIMAHLKELHINTPVYAIGGIEGEDIESILKTGIYGVALSGYITGYPQKKELFNQLYVL